MVDEDGDLGGQRAGRSAAETVGAQWLPDLGHREHMQHGRRPDDGLFHGRALGIGELVVAAGVSRRLRRLERPAANASGPFQAPAPSTTAAGTRSPPFRRLVNPAREEGAGRLPRPRSKKVELHSIDFFDFFRFHGRKLAAKPRLRPDIWKGAPIGGRRRWWANQSRRRCGRLPATRRRWPHPMTRTPRGGGVMLPYSAGSNVHRLRRSSSMPPPGRTDTAPPPGA